MTNRNRATVLDLSLHKFHQPRKTFWQKLKECITGRKSVEECVREAAIKGQPARP